MWNYFIKREKEFYASTVDFISAPKISWIARQDDRNLHSWDLINTSNVH